MPLRHRAEAGPGPSRAPTEWIRHDPAFVEAAHAAALTDLDPLSARDLGQAVTDHRSSWVRRVTIDTFDVYIKVYDYPTWRDRVRGVLRTTAWRPSRAAAEWTALIWLRARGFAAPRPLAVLERRRHGLLRRAVLVSEAFPGEPLDRLLPTLEPDGRDTLLEAVEELVSRLHCAGFRDRNLDLRNLLAVRRDGIWEIAVIDSPRHRLVPPGPAHDKLARQDWDRLAASLAAADSWLRA